MLDRESIEILQSRLDKALSDLDKQHQKRGDYEEWMMSDERKQIAGPNHHVRVVNWRNLEEVCEKAGLNPIKMRAAYQQALAAGDVIFVTYDEVPCSSD